MINNSCGVVLLTSICMVGFALHASDNQKNKDMYCLTKEYQFNTFDIDIFTNRLTQEVELIYPSSLVKEVGGYMLKVPKLSLEPLVYAALTRIMSKKNDRYNRSLIQKSEQKNAVDIREETRINEKLSAVYNQMKYVEKECEEAVDAVSIGVGKFMTLVQYAAYKIEHHDTHSEIILNSDFGMTCSFKDEAKNLLYHYKLCERKFAKD